MCRVGTAENDKKTWFDNNEGGLNEDEIKLQEWTLEPATKPCRSLLSPVSVMKNGEYEDVGNREVTDPWSVGIYLNMFIK